MGRGRNRKPRNFATFRLCPRPGAADASDRVFVRVDDNPYSVPGFAEDDGHGHGAGPSSSSTTGGVDGPSSSAENGALPDRVRREILELGLPDDGYDYLAHLRELRPSLSSTGGGGSSAVFLHSRRPARSGLPVDVKAYDLSRAPIGSGEVAETVSLVEEAIDLDVANLVDGNDLPAVESGDEDLEEDFVILANQPDEEQQIEAEEKNICVIDDLEEDKIEGCGGKEKAREQFDSLGLEDCADGEDDCLVQDVEHELSHEVIDELKLPHSENFDADEGNRAPQYIAHMAMESGTKEQIGTSSNAIIECAGYAERYELRKEEQVVLVPESSDCSAARYCVTTVSRSYLDLHPGKILVPDKAKKKLPKLSPGETSMKKAIIKKGMEKLPVEYLPQRKTSNGDKLK
uniref:Uncharacterized protein n=1 Tax=Arundo donax TaxID=35708 RepID=A0A0A9F244_ARUDO